MEGIMIVSILTLLRLVVPAALLLLVGERLLHRNKRPQEAPRAK